MRRNKLEEYNDYLCLLYTSKQLRDEGVLTETEFQKQKDLLLNPGWEEFVVDFEAEEGKED